MRLARASALCCVDRTEKCNTIVRHPNTSDARTVTETGNRKKRRRRGTKDKVVQARIPQDLQAELHTRAGQLGLSVSAIVRNVLLNTFDLVEDVVNDSAGVARAIEGRQPERDVSVQLAAQTPPDTGESGPVGWQELVLNVNGVCENCNALLPRGQHAAIGIPVRRRPVFLCLSCLAGLSGSADEKAIVTHDSSEAGRAKSRRSDHHQ